MLASVVIDEEIISVSVTLGAIDDSCTEDISEELLSTIGVDTISSELISIDVDTKLEEISRELASTLDDKPTAELDLDTVLSVLSTAELDTMLDSDTGDKIVELLSATIVETISSELIPIDEDPEVDVNSRELASKLDDKRTEELDLNTLLSVLCTAELDTLSDTTDVVSSSRSTEVKYSLEKILEVTLSSIPLEVDVGKGVAELTLDATQTPVFVSR